jgi:nucleolar complex protein 3
VIRLHELYRLANGTAKEVHPLLEGVARRLAAEALTGVFIDIAPGFEIRTLSEEEQKRQTKLETRRAQQYESTLLEVYRKFLALLDTNTMGLLRWPEGCEVQCQHISAPFHSLALLAKHSGQGDGEHSVVTKKLAHSSVECLCRLMENLGHFNYVNEIASSLIRLCVSSTPPEVLDRIGAALSTTFKQDRLLTTTLHIVKRVAEFVNGKRSYVWPGLISTLLSLSIRVSRCLLPWGFDDSQCCSREFRSLISASR